MIQTSDQERLCRALMDLCQGYGVTTDVTREHLLAATESLVDLGD